MLDKTPEGKSAMAAIHPDMTALVPPDDGDYDSLRQVMELPGAGGAGR